MIEYIVKVEADGSKFWHLKGKIHREDGPAIEYANGSKHWCLNGKQLTEQEFNACRAVVHACRAVDIG